MLGAASAQHVRQRVSSTESLPSLSSDAVGRTIPSGSSHLQTTDNNNVGMTAKAGGGGTGAGGVLWLVTEGPGVLMGARWHRWVSLGLGVCMQLTAGTLYSITAWGVPLKEAAGWSEDGDLNLAETCGTLGVYVAIHNGLMMDTFGARRTLLVGALLLLTGWRMLANVAESGGSPAGPDTRWVEFCH